MMIFLPARAVSVAGSRAADAASFNASRRVSVCGDVGFIGTPVL
jgi:hypothetical protein